MRPTPPDDAYCAVDGCPLPATRLRPLTGAWLGPDPIAHAREGSEWVCHLHAPKELTMLDRLRSIVDPAVRQRIYQTVAVFVGVLVGAGLVTREVADSWAALVIADLDAAAMVMALIHVRRWSRAAIYAAALAVTAALVGTGLLTDAQASAGMQAVTAVLGLAGIWLAAYRTDPDTPTGEPGDEYVARHAA